jgi:hypothetical protein
MKKFKCCDCKHWDKDNQKLARIRLGGENGLEEYGVASCIHGGDDTVLMSYCYESYCRYFLPNKCSLTTGELENLVEKYGEEKTREIIAAIMKE